MRRPADEEAILAPCPGKYESWDWTFARSPRFHYEKSFLFQGKDWVLLAFDCEAGHLNRVSIRITGQAKQELAALFGGQRLDPTSLQATHRPFPVSGVGGGGFVAAFLWMILI